MILLIIELCRLPTMEAKAMKYNGDGVQLHRSE